MGRCKSNMKVVSYHLDGTIFRIYDSAKEASINRKCHPRTIDKCIRGDTLTANGYMWRRFEENNIPNQIEPLRKKEMTYASIPIAEINEKGDVISLFPSINKASKILGIDPHSIRDVLNNKNKKCNGHMFRYLNKNELEKENINLENRKITGKKPVIQYSLDDKYIKQYPSISKAAEALGKKPLGILLAVKGKFKTAYGYKWRYKK